MHFPKSCLHCEDAACVTVCPTGASYKRAEDGIVLVNESICIGCKLCSWACPYGAREFDADEGVMKKCTLCIDRIYNENLVPEERQPACVMVCPTKARFFGDLGDPNSAVSELVATRGGKDLMPELGYRPVNKYLPPSRNRHVPDFAAAEAGAGRNRSPRPAACCAGSTACCRDRGLVTAGASGASHIMPDVATIGTIVADSANSPIPDRTDLPIPCLPEIRSLPEFAARQKFPCSRSREYATTSAVLLAF